MRRQELKSTMMTINRPLEDWGKLIGDVPSATAILDRFLHRSALFLLTVRSYCSGASENGEPRGEPRGDTPLLV
jgi:DNA replication protein DnaC